MKALMNVIDSGLKESLQTDVIIPFPHSVYRLLFKGKGNVCGNRSFALSPEDFPVKYFPREWDRGCRNARGTVRALIYPIYLRPFLGRSRQLFNPDGTKARRRWIQKLTMSFRKRTL